ncbi:membrane-fusion protein [Serpentinimonas raichei]|uniref:Membrane-fusion protein n=1 Tax=Serpentinimonas raichei TaxID=1458425 RepID=A0A060NG48_9BURK|nr:efflux RND transporter periplasmic adaptor subunit [Serpentinimonas raichei]BAO80631.1 membrane-fusion protein [Serpentinimonas raichei]
MSSEDPSSSLDAAALLSAATPARRWWRSPRLWVALAALALALLALWFWNTSQQRQAAPVYQTEPLARGTLARTVTANGTLQPVRAVNIGSELSGTVRTVHVDINDPVRRGQVLLELDTERLQDQVRHGRAALAAAQAQVALAQASQLEAEATLREAQAQLARLQEVQRLSGGKVPSAAELDTARAAAERAQAALERNRANVLNAQAGVEQARANLSSHETNLGKASIRSPIDGVVLARSVDPGNAVAASLQAVTLLQLAQDLRQLELQVSVDEADIGVVSAGQPATFTVSSQPARRFAGQVSRVAFGATRADNVVTYTTTIRVENQDLSLRPGMTATASIVAVQRDNVLLVPNAALRFLPSDPAGAAPGGGGVLASLLPRLPAAAPRVARIDPRPGQRQIWVLQDGQPVPLQVSTGITDGRQTEVSGEGVVEGLAVIVSQGRAGGAGRP